MSWGDRFCWRKRGGGTFGHGCCIGSLFWGRSICLQFVHLVQTNARSDMLGGVWLTWSRRCWLLLSCRRKCLVVGCWFSLWNMIVVSSYIIWSFRLFSLNVRLVIIKVFSKAYSDSFTSWVMGNTLCISKKLLPNSESTFIFISAVFITCLSVAWRRYVDISCNHVAVIFKDGKYCMHRICPMPPETNEMLCKQSSWRHSSLYG